MRNDRDFRHFGRALDKKVAKIQAFKAVLRSRSGFVWLRLRIMSTALDTD